MTAAVAQPTELQLLREEIAALRAQIAWLKKKLFGGGRSEKLDRAQARQAQLALDALAPIAATPPPAKTITYERPVGPAPQRTPPAVSFAHLPVKETVEIVPAEVRAAPDDFEKIGEERTFEVDLIPPQFFKREIVRPKFRARLDRARAPLLAPAPPRVVPGGFASAGLIAWTIIAKYTDHLPLYRQEKMFARWGAPLSRQNLCDWIGSATALLEPLAKKMKQDLLAGGYVIADETPIRCNDPDLRDGQTTTGYLWALTGPGAPPRPALPGRPDQSAGDVVFEWRDSRRHEEAARLLGSDYQGLLQSDAYAAYPAYVRAHPGVVWLGCWAHARRGFHDALAEAPVRAGFVLRLIGALYGYEAQWRTAGPALRAARRQGHFGLTLALLQKTALRLRDLCLPRSQLGQACTYLLGQWAALTAHLAHGRTRLDTNAVENAIRPSKLGAKNWLFVGHPDAGDRPAVLYSLLLSAQRRGHEPHAYLKDLLTRLPAMTNQDDLAPLLPRNWRPPSAA